MSNQEMERYKLDRFKHNLVMMKGKLDSVSKFRPLKRRKIIREFQNYLYEEIKYKNSGDKNLEVLKQRLLQTLYELQEGEAFAEDDFQLIYEYLVVKLKEIIEK